jgi:hypothetical protein
VDAAAYNLPTHSVLRNSVQGIPAAASVVSLSLLPLLSAAAVVFNFQINFVRQIMVRGIPVLGYPVSLLPPLLLLSAVAEEFNSPTRFVPRHMVLGIFVPESTASPVLAHQLPLRRLRHRLSSAAAVESNIPTHSVPRNSVWDIPAPAYRASLQPPPPPRQAGLPHPVPPSLNLQ